MIIALIADIHEDIRFLEKALKQADKFNADKIICLGDITGYSSENQNFLKEKDANECINLLQTHCDINIAGNHDLFSAQKLSDYSAGINYPENWFSLTYDEKFKIFGNEIWLYEHEIIPNLKPEHIEWLKNLPEFVEFKTETHKIGLSHYIFPDLSGSLVMGSEVNSDAKLHREHFSCDLYISGHLHPKGNFVQNIKDFKWKNYAFNKEVKLENNSFLIIPAVVRHETNSGLQIIDTNTMTSISIQLK